MIKIYYLGCFETLPKETIVSKIKKARLYYGLNKKEFATRLGVDVHTLIDWKNGVHESAAKYMDCLFSYLTILNIS